MNEAEHLPIEGKTVTSVDMTDDRLTLVCGDDAFVAYHMQDCCESVSIHDVSGDVQSLVGKQVVDATQEASGTWPSDVENPEWMPESFTWTTQAFRTSDGITVTVRWLGKSNGYYGEDVYFQRTHVPIEGE